MGRCGGEGGEEASHHVVFGIRGGSGGSLSTKQCSYPLLNMEGYVGVTEVSVVVSVVPKVMLVGAV